MGDFLLLSLGTAAQRIRRNSNCNVEAAEKTKSIRTIKN
jgi:hypothetical protein